MIAFAAIGVLVLALLPTGGSAGTPVTLTVNDPSNNDDGACEPLNVGDCTLHEAVDAANAGGVGTIDFDPTVFPTANPSTIDLSFDLGALPALTASGVTISADGAGVELDGAGTVARGLAVEAGQDGFDFEVSGAGGYLELLDFTDFGVQVCGASPIDTNCDDFTLGDVTISDLAATDIGDGDFLDAGIAVRAANLGNISIANNVLDLSAPVGSGIAVRARAGSTPTLGDGTPDLAANSVAVSGNTISGQGYLVRADFEGDLADGLYTCVCSNYGITATNDSAVAVSYAGELLGGTASLHVDGNGALAGEDLGIWIEVDAGFGDSESATVTATASSNESISSTNDEAVFVDVNICCGTSDSTSTVSVDGNGGPAADITSLGVHAVEIRNNVCCGAGNTSDVSVSNNWDIVGGGGGVSVESLAYGLTDGDHDHTSLVAVDGNGDIDGLADDAVQVTSLAGSAGGFSHGNTSSVSASFNGAITGQGAGDAVRITSFAGPFGGAHDGDQNQATAMVDGNGDMTGDDSGVRIDASAGGGTPTSDENATTVSVSGGQAIAGLGTMTSGEAISIGVSTCCDPANVNDVQISNHIGSITAGGGAIEVDAACCNESQVVLDNLPGGITGDGDGIQISVPDGPGAHTAVTIEDTVVEDSIGTGVILCCGDFSGSVIRDSVISDNLDGGIRLTDTSGVQVGPGNSITLNGSATGIHIEGDGSDGNTITQNAIWDNEDLGIDLVDPVGVGCTDGSGPNECLAPPTLVTLSNYTLIGDTCAFCTVEVFLADNDPPDQSDHGEGALYLTSDAADSFGNFLAVLPCSPDIGELTATATDPSGNTSEFSENLAFVTPGCGSINGTVTENGTGTPLEGVCVEAYELSGGLASSDVTDVSGDYSVGGLEEDDYRVRFDDCTSPVTHVTEWYDDKTDSFLANPVSVTAATKTAGIDAALELGGSINGTVTEDGSGTPLEGICVDAFEDGGGGFGFAQTDASGDYSIAALPAGAYQVQFRDCNAPVVYVSEYYDDQPDFASADPVTISAGSKTSGIDAALAVGGSINGTVTEDGSGAPLANICVSAFSGTPFGFGFATTDASGNYTIGGLRTADYEVSFDDCSSPATYVAEYYDDQPDSTTADLVSVTLGAKTSGIDAALAIGGTINGTVTEDGSGTPLEGVCVQAVPMGGGSTEFGQTDAAGNYTVGGLAGGDHWVRFSDCQSPITYIPEWYDDQPDIGTADVVAVTLGAKTGGIDAALAVGGSINGTVTEEGSGTPLPGTCVQATQVSGSASGFTSTDAFGSYNMGALPSGDYLVQFFECVSEPTHIDEWYDDQPSSLFADPVSVTAPSKTAGIDAALAIGGSINGTVTEEGSGTPLQNICVTLYDAVGPFVAFTQTNALGDYSIGGLADGDYKLQFGGCNPESGYIGEWYNDKIDLASADAVSVSAGGKTAGIDAALILGGSISGTVTEEGSGTPLEGICVNAFPAASSSAAASDTTDASGNYSIGALLGDDYSVQFVDCTVPITHEFEWYDDQANRDNADTVAVTVGLKTAGIDAELGLGGSINGNVTDAKSGQPLQSYCVGAYDGSSTGLLDVPGLVAFDFTDAFGDYELAGLRPNDYALSFAPCLLPPEPIEWYDDQPDEASADPVTVTAGAKVAGIDADLELDLDGDGCSDVRENGADPTQGGQRDYSNPHDYFDTNGDQYVDLPNDILGVVQRWSSNPQQPYDPAYDRGPTQGPNPWNMTAPDGTIDLPNDILGVILQWQHDCR